MDKPYKQAITEEKTHIVNKNTKRSLNSQEFKDMQIKIIN